MKIPNHVGLIVDGNGRWAIERNKSRSEGHLQGYENFKKMVHYIFSKNVKYISAYLFSTENFKRSKVEVDYLMNLLTSKMLEIIDVCEKAHARFVWSGRKEGLSKKVIATLEKIENETKKYDEHVINICFNYGSHAEIIDACKKIYEDVSNKKLDINKLDENTFSKYLYQDLPPIDLLIRTSGEQRLSNFMLWQCSYAEFYFPKVYFPDFDEKEFDKALEEYTKRDRRYGGIDYAKKNH